jgi:cytochrome c553
MLLYKLRPATALRLAKGEALVMKGQCALCHGADLRGLGPLPSIAGRSPSYMFRQLYDFRHGARNGEWSPLMVQAVATLDEQDLLAIVAYLASRGP